MIESKTCLGHEWKQLPTEELDKILQAELEKEHPDEDVVLPILQIIEEREKDYPAEDNPEALAILEKLSEHDTSSNQLKTRRRWIAGAAALVAVACVVVMALPRTVGAESIFSVLFRWTSGVFDFFTPEKDAKNPPVEYVFETDNSGLQQLYGKVTELGVTEPIVPMWMPEEFELISLKATQIRDEGYKVSALFKNDEKMVSFSYRISRDVSTKVEKENTAVELYDYADVHHFILENGENWVVTWVVDGVECLINTNMSKDDIYTIIKSIYRSEL